MTDPVLDNQLKCRITEIGSLTVTRGGQDSAVIGHEVKPPGFADAKIAKLLNYFLLSLIKIGLQGINTRVFERLVRFVHFASYPAQLGAHPGLAEIMCQAFHDHHSSQRDNKRNGKNDADGKQIQLLLESHGMSIFPITG